ncbi:unnamed protein product [Durusdinium trenchii]|uniref:Calmodulin n=1 Tax=Durusdinium trenchii TaxID=1381693 RepID=A0ABP0IM58_9DINO
MRRKVDLNAYRCSPPVSEYAFTDDGQSNASKARSEAYGVFPLASLFNHSCAPNMSKVLLGKWVFLRAAREIPPGEELTQFYCDIRMPVEMRQKELSDLPFGKSAKGCRFELLLDTESEEFQPWKRLYSCAVPLLQQRFSSELEGLIADAERCARRALAERFIDPRVLGSVAFSLDGRFEESLALWRRSERLVKSVVPLSNIHLRVHSEMLLTSEADADLRENLSLVASAFGPGIEVWQKLVGFRMPRLSKKVMDTSPKPDLCPIHYEWEETEQNWLLVAWSAAFQHAQDIFLDASADVLLFNAPNAVETKVTTFGASMFLSPPKDYNQLSVKAAKEIPAPGSSNGPSEAVSVIGGAGLIIVLALFVFGVGIVVPTKGRLCGLRNEPTDHFTTQALFNAMSQNPDLGAALEASEDAEKHAETQRPERPASPTSPTSPISPTSNKTKDGAVAGKSVTEEEIERCIAEADKNGNGIIEYNEFIEWLQQPCGTVRLGSHGLEYFDLEACVRPLYDVYDQDGDGLVSMEEFIGCQSILQNSLGLKSKVSLEEQFKKEFGRPGTTSVPLLESEPKKTFLMVDSDKSRSISFKEFLEWQRKQLIAARTPSKELEELLPALARQLKRVFKFEEEEEMNACDGRVLQRIVDNLAKFCIEIWSEKEGAKQKAKPMLALTGKARHYTNRWSEPPVGLNTKKLKAKYLATESCMTSGRLSENMDLDLMVIPEVLDGDDENPRNRVWLGQIIQKVTMRDGKVRSDEPVYYEFISLSWSKTADAVFKFHRSYDAMPPELRFFSLLKAEADFGNKLTWSQIQRVFARCKSHGILTAAQHAEYNNAMELRVHKALKEEESFLGHDVFLCIGMGGPSTDSD